MGTEPKKAGKKAGEQTESTEAEKQAAKKKEMIQVLEKKTVSRQVTEIAAEFRRLRMLLCM